MAGLQRSSLSFRRQGSSGFVWDDKFLSGELKQQQVTQGQENPEENHEIIMVKEVKPLRPIKTVQRSRSNGGGRGYRSSGKISPAIEPPSPKVSACGLCGSFGKSSRKNINAVRGANPGKRGRPRY